ncbi:hypothetical protein GCM10029978_053930 [Actinoallomurus acanthiterrae]
MAYPGERVGVGEPGQQVLRRAHGHGAYGEALRHSYSEVHENPLYGKVEPVQTAGSGGFREPQETDPTWMYVRL